jgi:DNA-directed RNA polymerase subunit D
MGLSVISGSDEELRFRWSDTSPSLANCLRRVILTEVPTLAVEDVVFIENESPMSDEHIAHVLAMIPLTTPPQGTYVFPKDADTKRDDQRSRATLTIDLQAKDGVLEVTSGQLTSDDPAVKPVTPNITITKLAPGKRLKLEAYAVLGAGRTHAKFQPVSTVYYKFQPVIEIDLKRCDACAKCVESCPKGVIRLEKGKIAVIDPEQCTQCADCVKACPSDPPSIKMSELPDTVLFTVESTGAIPAGRIVSEAFDIMKERFNSIKSELGEAN